MNSRIAGLIGFLVLIGVLVGTVLSRSGPEPPRPDRRPPPANPSPTPRPAAPDRPPGTSAKRDDEPARAVLVGMITGEKANVAASIPGKVVSIAGALGDRVAAGQVVVTLDDRQLRQQSEQAHEAVEAARQSWGKAVVGRELKEKDIQGNIAEAESGLEAAKQQRDKAKLGLKSAADLGKSEIARAKNAVATAEASLLLAMRGPRPEERRKAELALEATRRALELTQKNVDTMRDLVAQGGVPRARLDAAQADHNAAKAQFDQADQTLRQVLAGARPEELRTAQLGVEQAREGLTAAEEGARNRKLASQKDVDAAELQITNADRAVQRARGSTAQLRLLDADIKAAEAALRQASAQSEIATDQIQFTRLLSPIAGVISSVDIHVGEIASPGRPLLAVMGTSGLYMETSVPERLLPIFRPGVAVEIEADSLRGQKLSGRVREVSVAANPDGRSYPARIDLLDGDTNRLRPGARVRATRPLTPERRPGRSGRGSSARP